MPRRGPGFTVRRGAALFALCGLVAALCVAAPRQAYAQACEDLRVFAADGDSALADAVELANRCVGPQVIEVEGGDLRIDRQIDVTDALTITGDQARPTTLQPLTTGSLFVVATGASLELNRLWIDAPSGTGLVSVSAGTIRLSAVDFRTPAGGCGEGSYDAIDALASQVVLTDVTITNAACYGVRATGGSNVTMLRTDLLQSGSHGILIDGTIEIDDSNVHNNGGAGLTTDQKPTVRITNSSFYGNTASGIEQDGGSLTVSTSTLGSTRTGNPAGNGGHGASVVATQVDLSLTDVGHNTLGGLRLDPAGETAQLTRMSIHDHQGPGIESLSGVAMVSGTTMRNNTPDCKIADDGIDNVDNNSDSDGTCFPPEPLPPVAANDQYATDEDVELVSDAATGVLANDIDASTATLVTPPATGELVLEPSGAFTYTPGLDDNGAVTFTYVARGEAEPPSQATVTIEIAPVNDPPVAVPDSFTTAMNTALELDLVGNDSDVEDETLENSRIVTEPTDGSLWLDDFGVWTYTPDDGFVGTDSFVYVATDAFNAESNEALATIEVRSVMREPQIADIGLQVTPEDTPLVVPLDITPGITPLLDLTVTVSGPEKVGGTVVVDSSNTFFTYTPASETSSYVWTTVTVTDGTYTVETPRFGLQVDRVNDAPVGNPDEYSVERNELLIVDAIDSVLRNDVDVDSQARLSIESWTDPEYGAITGFDDGRFRYVPLLDFVGIDTFQYVVTDGELSDGPITVTIIVEGPPDGPVTALAASLDETTACTFGEVTMVDDVAVTDLVVPPGWADGRPNVFACVRVTNGGTSQATHIRTSGQPSSLELDQELDPPLNPGETRLVQVGSVSVVPDSLGFSVLLFDSADNTIDIDQVRVDVDAPELTGSISTWTTAGPDVFTACNDNFVLGADGTATGQAAIAATGSTELWLCTSMRNNASGTISLHGIVTDPELDDEIRPPRPFEIAAAPGEVVQRVYGPIPASIDGGDTGFDIVWQAMAPPFDPLISDLSRVRFVAVENPRLVVTGGSGSEDGPAVFQLTLQDPVTNAPLAADVTVQISTLDQSATAGSDYVGVSESVSFAADGNQTFTVQLIDDDLGEADETFALTISSGDSVDIVDTAPVFTIIDDDTDTSEPIFSVRLGRSLSTACDGPLVLNGDGPPTGTLELPPGGDADMPLFACARYRNTTGLPQVLHRLQLGDLSPADTPFAPEISHTVAPGETYQRVVGPVVGLSGSAEWLWTAFDSAFDPTERAAITQVRVTEFSGEVQATAGISASEPGACDGNEPESITVPWGQGAGSEGFQVWYCLQVTNDGSAAISDFEIRLEDRDAPVSVNASGGLAAGQTRRFVIGPVTDHPDDFQSLTDRRIIEWIGLGPGYVPGVDDEEVAIAVASVSVVETLEGAPLIAATSPSVQEGPSVIPQVVEVAIRPGPGLLESVTVDVSVNPQAGLVLGNACSTGIDVVDPGATGFVVGPGLTNPTLDLIVCGDDIDEDDEILEVEIREAGLNGAVLATSSVTIVDDDAALLFGDAPDLEVTERDNYEHETIEVVIPLVEPAESPREFAIGVGGDELAYSFGCFDGTDVRIGKFSLAAVPDVVIEAGATELRFEIDICADLYPELTESATIVIQDYATFRSLLEFELTVFDEDAFPQIRGIDDIDWEDSGGGFRPQVEFEVITPSELPWTFDVATRGIEPSTNGVCGLFQVDYTPVVPSVTVDFPALEPGERILVPVPACADGVIEDDFEIDIILTPQDAPSLALGLPAEARVLIQDDDQPPSMQGVTQLTVDEGTGTGLTFVDVSLPIAVPARAPFYGIEIRERRDAGDATYGSCGPFVDLAGLVGELPGFIQHGDESLDFRVVVCADDVPEPDRVAWFEVWDNHDQKIIATVALTIEDDDPFVTGMDTVVDESVGIARVSFDVESPSLIPLWVTSRNGTAVGDPLGNGDFVSPSGPFRTLPGQTGIVEVAVTINDDALPENDESFFVEVWDAPAGGERVAMAQVTIVDDDAAPVVALADVVVTEGPATSVLELLDASFDGIWPSSTGALVTLADVELVVIQPAERLYELRLRAPGVADDSASGSPLCESTVLTGLTDYRVAPGGLLTDAFEIPPVVPGAVFEIGDVAVACGDLAVEGDETYRIEVLDELDNVLDSATVTIVDDDVHAGIEVGDVEVAESDSGSVTVEVTAPAFTPLWIRTVAGSADAGSDYTPSGEGLAGPELLRTIPGRTGPVTVALGVQDDNDPEPDETFTVEIWNAPVGGLRLADFDVTIIDDDASAVVKGADAAVQEDAGTVDVRFDVVEPGQVDTTFWAAVASGTAIEGNGNDVVGFGLTRIPFTLPDGVTAPFSLPVQIIDDAAQEGEEHFSVRLFDQPLFGNEVARATITIAANDRDLPVLDSPPILEVVEGTSNRVEFVVLEKSTHAQVDLQVGWVPVTPGVVVGGCFPTATDASVSTGLRQLSRTSDSLDVTVAACDDPAVQGTVEFDVVIASADGDELARARVRVVDDDRPPVVVLRDITIDEGDPTGPIYNPMFRTRGLLTVEVVEAPQRAYRLSVQHDGRGPANVTGINCLPTPFGQADAVFVAREIIVPAGTAGQVIEVETLLACQNTEPQADRWYGLELVDGFDEVGGVFDQAQVTIVDDDGPSTGVSIADAVIDEGDSGSATVEVMVTVADGDTPVDVDWAVLPLPSDAPVRQATSGADFELDNGSLYFPPGGGTQAIDVQINGDEIAEGDESFRVVISSSSGDVVDSEAIVRIVDDDALRVSVADPVAVLEGDDGTTLMSFEVTLDSQPSSLATVRWETVWVSGLAIPDDPVLAQPFYADEPDFVHSLGTLYFQPNEPRTKTVTIEVLGDHRIEFDEHIYFYLVEPTAPGQPVIGDGSAVGVILNDDELDGVPPAIVGADNVRVALTSAGTRQPVSYQVSAVDLRDGERPVSCLPVSGSLFDLGDTTVTCTATDLEGNEASETFVVTVDQTGGKVAVDADSRDARDGDSGSEVPTARAGQAIFVRASGFAPNSRGRAEMRSEPIDLGPFEADQDGEVLIDTLVPLDAMPGRHTIVLIGVDAEGAEFEVRLPIEVVSGDSASPTFTG